MGGHFYEFYQLGDGRVGFVVGDATVKGVPAAIVTTATAAYMGGVAAASDSSPGEALALANEALFARIPPNMFVTCFYAILDMPPPSTWRKPRRTSLRRRRSCAAHSSRVKLCTTRYVGRGWFVHPCLGADNKG